MESIPREEINPGFDGPQEPIYEQTKAEDNIKSTNVNKNAIFIGLAMLAGTLILMYKIGSKS